MSNETISGLGAGTMQLVSALTIKDGSGTTTFAASADGTATTFTRTLQKLLQARGAKVGGTSGAVVNAADNKNSLARVPASQTASTIVVPLDNLKVGDIITAFHLVGQIESAGGTVTVDAELRKQTAAAADLADASVSSMTQLSVTADTIMSASNTAKTLASADTVGADETFYVLITVTTAGSTDVDLQAVAVTVTQN